MKNKIAFGLCAAGLGIASHFWSMHAGCLKQRDKPDYVLAVKITAVGLVIAGAGIILNKIKERETFDNHTLSHQ